MYPVDSFRNFVSVLVLVIMYLFFVRFSNIVFVFGFWFVIILYCILVCSSFGFCVRSFRFWGLIMRLVLGTRSFAWLSYYDCSLVLILLG